MNPLYKIQYFLKFWAFLVPVFIYNQNPEMDSLKNVVQTSKNDSLVIDAYNKLFFSTVYSDKKTAKNYIGILSKMGEKNPYAKARAHNLKGIYLDIEGKYDSAKILYLKAIQISVGKFPNVEGSAYNNLGLIQWNRGSYYEALKSYNKALQLFEKTENKKLSANVLSNIGLIYDEINDKKRFEDYTKKALGLREEIKDDYGISVSLVNLANLYSKQKKIAEAKDHYEKAIVYKKKVNDEVGLSLLYHNYACLEYQKNNFQKSLSLLDQAKNYSQKSEGESINQLNIFLTYGDNYIQLKRFEDFKKILPKIESLIKNHHDDKSLMNYYDMMTHYHEVTKNFEKAYYFEGKRDSLETVMENAEVQKAINLYETQYKVEKKEKELSQTKNKLLFQESENRKKNTYLLISGLVLLFAFITAFLISRALRLKNKHQKKEFELQTAIEKIDYQNRLQEQRLSISRDLHDNIGAQLTFIISSIHTLKSTFKIEDHNINNKLNNISNFTKDTITELRDTIWAMNNAEITFSEINKRILNFLSKAQNSFENVNFTFNVDPSLENIKFSSSEGMNIYRIIQEAVNNSLKYSHAKNINIEVKNIQNDILVEIFDDGKGFDEKEITPGSGLLNMKKRASEIGKNFKILSEKGKGTLVSFVLNKN